MLGDISIPRNDIINDFYIYLNKMSKAGFTSIFTSLHIPEDDTSKYTERLRALGTAAKRNNMELMAHISPVTPASPGKTPQDYWNGA